MSNIVNTNNTDSAEVALAQENSIGIAGIEGFGKDVVLKRTPYLIMVQGSDNTLKDKYKANDGEFWTNAGEKIADAEKPFEFILLKTSKIYKELEVEVSDSGKLNTRAKALQVLSMHEFHNLPKPAQKTKSDELIVFKDAEGTVERVFLPTYILLGFVDNKPYQMSMWTFSKVATSEDIVAALAVAKVSRPVDVVFELVSEKTKNKDGRSYWKIASKVARKSTKKDIEGIADYLDLEIEIDEAE